MGYNGNPQSAPYIVNGLALNFFEGRSPLPLTLPPPHLYNIISEDSLAVWLLAYPNTSYVLHASHCSDWLFATLCGVTLSKCSLLSVCCATHVVCISPQCDLMIALQWRRNERDGVSNHQPHDCLQNRLFWRRSKKTSKLRVISLCEGNSPVTGEFPAQRTSNAENVSGSWRHHVVVCHAVRVLCVSPSIHNGCFMYTSNIWNLYKSCFSSSRCTVTVHLE